MVAVSLNLFDRYLATLGNHCSGNKALLTSLTTVHIAMKLNDTKKISLGTLANLSRGQFGPKDIEEMEWTILSALHWRLHPPTQYAFVSHLLLLLPREVNFSVRNGLSEVSLYLTELAVCDSYFVDVPNSTVAFAAILIVMEDTNYARLSGGLREKFLTTLKYKVGLHHAAPDVVNARQRLRKMFASTKATLGNAFSPQPPVPAAYGCGMEHSNFGEENSSLADQHHHHYTNLSSSSSVGSMGSTKNAPANGFRSRTNSIDNNSSSGGSKGSCRYSPSLRRSFVASVSPVSCASRASVSPSPIVAGVQ